MAKFFTGFFIGAVAMMFLISKGELMEEEENEACSERAAADALSKAKTSQQQ